MTPDKSPSKKEAGVNVEAEEARISNSDVAGRDHIEGISAEDLRQIIETLLKYFPRSYLQNPEELDKTLNDFRLYHEQLREYKELHNKINQILVAFEPFKAEMNRLSLMKIAPELEHLITLWFPVSRRVEELLNWSQTVKYIGKSAQKPGNKKRNAISWAVDFKELRNQIERLGLSEYYIRNNEYFNEPRNFFRRSKNTIFWLKILIEYTSRFNNITFTYMDTADDQLRQTAQELLNLSDKALSSIKV